MIPRTAEAVLALRAQIMARLFDLNAYGPAVFERRLIEDAVDTGKLLIVRRCPVLGNPDLHFFHYELR